MLDELMCKPTGRHDWKFMKNALTMLGNNAKLPLTTCCHHNPPILLSDQEDLEGQQELPTNRLVATIAQD